MYIDKNLQVAVSSRITASGNSDTDYIDLSDPRELGQGGKLRLHVHVHQNLRTDFSQGTGASSTNFTYSNSVTNINCNILMATDSTGGGATIVGALTPRASADWTKPVIVEINPFVKPLTAAFGSTGYRYMFARLNLDGPFTTSTGSASGFVFSAELVRDVQADRNYYPSGFTMEVI